MRSSVACLGLALSAPENMVRGESAAVFDSHAGTSSRDRPLTLFLAGDVMTGRGVDQILPHPVDPRLHEAYVKRADTYVRLAEAKHGRIPTPVPYPYVWGEALDELARVRPDARIVNLETAVTTSNDWWRGKGIHYRMHPANVPVLTAAGLDVCVLGNNHVMDWGHTGLRETLAVLRAAGLRTAGAGLDREEAAAPAVLETRTGRVLVFSYGTPDAGVPPAWAAGTNRPGVNLLPALDARGARQVIDAVRTHRHTGDRVVVSLHWGANWGYAIPPAQRDFAHRLVDAGAADVIHGHSSHHPKGIEVYRRRPILYGAGDLINDYEGIEGYEAFRSNLRLLYFPALDENGALLSLEMAPVQIRRFRLERAPEAAVHWLAEVLDRESRRFGTRVEVTPRGRLALRWNTP
ncbi:MAG: capsule biosynthesis protein [Rhodothermaceae bacterium]|nr:MAG: capsule biosynthesis protein [Rhodothermaceae bacterium]